MGQLLLEYSRNREFGEAIFEGKLALYALDIIRKSDLLMPQQEKLLDRLFQTEHGLALVLLDQFNRTRQKIEGRLREAEEKGRGPGERDAEFHEIVTQQTVWVERQIDLLRGSYDAEGRERAVQKLIDKQILLARKGIEARQSLIINNWLLADDEAKHSLWFRLGRSDIDILSYAENGLIEAATEYDYRLGGFANYAIPIIRQHIKKGIAGAGFPAKLPLHVFRKLGELKKEQTWLTQEFGEDPDIGALIKRLDTAKQTLAYAVQIAHVVSLDKPIGGGRCTHRDFITAGDDVQNPQKIVEEEELRGEVREAVDSLPKQEANVIIRRLDIGGDGRVRTQEEVGREFNLTHGRVGQIQASALRKLRNMARLRELPRDPKAEKITVAQAVWNGRVPQRGRKRVKAEAVASS